jgi:hypothetical protein
MNEEKVVTIRMVNGLPVPDMDPVEVKKDNHKIRWCADFDFRITVEGYTDIKHSSGGSGSCAFGAKSGPFSTIKRYKYTISANGVDNDPMIDVKPGP